MNDESPHTHISTYYVNTYIHVHVHVGVAINEFSDGVIRVGLALALQNNC